jgi:hypothetical protein
MIVEYKTSLDVRFAAPYKKKQWTLVSPFIFTVDGVEYVVPVGFYTDFASVPKIFWNLISPYDLGYGPIPHDFGYFTGIESKEYWDNVFNACMEKDQVRDWKRIVAYIAVSKFGSGTYNNYRKANTKHVLIHTQPKRFELSNWDRRLTA